MNQETEIRDRVISTPNILWKIKKSSIAKEAETNVYYYFTIFWKLKVKMVYAYKVHKNGVRTGDLSERIVIDMVVHKAPINYPKISFSISCGWLTTNSHDTLYIKTTQVILEDLIKHNRKHIEIWQNDIKVLKSQSQFPDDTLYFSCRVQLQDRLNHFTELVEEQSPLLSQSCVNALSVDMGNLLETSAATDVVLKCGGQSFPAHKCILSCRSSVFQAMFQNDFKESIQGVVDILDIEPSVLQQLIKYVYTGNIETTVESVESFCNLFKAADKYCIESLKERCVCLIKRSLEPRHACDVLLMSNLYRHKYLKAYTVSYIANRKEFLLSEDWQRFASHHSTLAQEVFLLYVRRAELKKSFYPHDMNF